MTTSKVKKMLLTDAAIALSRARCRPNRGPYSHPVVCVCLSLSLQCAAMVTRRRTTTTARREEKKNNKGSPTMSRLWQLSLLWRTHLFIKRICSRKDKKKSKLLCYVDFLFVFAAVFCCWYLFLFLSCIQNKWNIFAVLLSGLCKCLLAKCLRRGSTCIIYVRVYSTIYKYIYFLYTFISN